MPFDWAAPQARKLRDSLASSAKRYKSATQLPDEEVLLEGRRIPSTVIRVSTADLKHPRSSETSFEDIYRIDKTDMAIVKEVDRENTFRAYDGVTRFPVYEETVTFYPTTKLDPQNPDPSLFSFSAPPDATLVDKFPEPSKRSDLTGKAAPSLTLKTPDGRQVSLDSFHGKPLLIDFWATWCEPCVRSMPKLANLYQQTKDKGLVLLTFDKDEDAKDATDFLAKKHYAWANFHDEGDIGKAFGEHFGIPRTILIDVNGKIVYDRSGGNEDQLLAAVAKLGPEYASLAPKANPCVATK
jgi:thiol-disulfide isomerase/thioredoxin